MRSRYLQLTFLVILTLTLYSQAASHEFISFDDAKYVTDNPIVRGEFSPANLTRIFQPYYCNWHPLTLFSHLLDWKLFGAWAGGHHLVSVVIHTLSAGFLYLFFYAATARHAPSLLIAAFFALHPLHVEPVAWASSRKDVLAALFWILTCWAYVKYAQHSARAQKISGLPAGQAGMTMKLESYFYIASVFFYTLAAMSKGSVITLPLILLLLDVWPLERKKAPGLAQGIRPGAFLVEKIPFFLIAIICTLVNASAQISGACTKNFESVPLKFRAANAFVGYFEYLRKMIWPADLAIFYPYTRDAVSALLVLSGIILVIVATFLAIRSRKKYPWVFAGWFWYLISLLPMIQLAQTGGHAMADRYAYVPMIGIYAAIAFTVPSFAVLILVGIFGVLSWMQIGYWKTTETIFQHAASVTKNNFIAHISLGDYDTLQENFERAREEYEKAVAIRPDPSTLHNLATTYFALNDLEKAEINYLRALEMDPGQVISWVNLGLLFKKKGDWQKAGYYYARALALDSNHPQAVQGFSESLRAQGRNDEADRLTANKG